MSPTTIDSNIGILRWIKWGVIADVLTIKREAEHIVWYKQNDVTILIVNITLCPLNFLPAAPTSLSLSSLPSLSSSFNIPVIYPRSINLHHSNLFPQKFQILYRCAEGWFGEGKFGAEESNGCGDGVG